jgi:hypothetical protein
VRRLSLLGLALALSLAGSGRAEATVRDCGAIGGEGVTASSIVADGESCKVARRVADKVSKVTQAPWRGCTEVASRRVQLHQPCVRYGYTCKTLRRIAQGNGLRVGCRRGARSVKWNLQ